MDPKRLTAVMAERLYEDIKFVCQQNPTQIVDDDGTRVYNNLLARVRKHFPHVDVVEDFQDWNPRNIKYKDALVVAGQVHAMLQALTDVPRPPRPYPARPPLPVGASGTGTGPMPQSPPPRPASSSGENRLHPGITENRKPAGAAPRPSPDDRELYGHNPPPKRNEDGTIPFSLE